VKKSEHRKNKKKGRAKALPFPIKHRAILSPEAMKASIESGGKP